MRFWILFVEILFWEYGSSYIFCIIVAHVDIFKFGKFLVKGQIFKNKWLYGRFQYPKWKSSTYLLQYSFSFFKKGDYLCGCGSQKFEWWTKDMTTRKQIKGSLPSFISKQKAEKFWSIGKYRSSSMNLVDNFHYLYPWLT